MKTLTLVRDPDGCYYVIVPGIGRGPKANSATKAIRRYRARGIIHKPREMFFPQWEPGK